MDQLDRTQFLVFKLCMFSKINRTHPPLGQFAYQSVSACDDLALARIVGLFA